MMDEAPNFAEHRETLLPGQILLLAEPIFKYPGKDEGKQVKFIVPLGLEPWVEQRFSHPITEQQITETLADEYLSIASALKEMGVPFRVIIAHRQQIDEKFALAILQHFNVRGIALDKSIKETCFPRDMMVNFDGKMYINPGANFYFPDHSGVLSPLGEGGRVLKVDKKVFVPDPRGFVKTRSKYVKDIHTLSARFQFGFLPFPLAVEVDSQTGRKTIFPNDHLDRVAAFIKGKDDNEYLLLDANYVSETQTPYGKHWDRIKEACEQLAVIPVVIKRKPESIPYALNLDQFADGTVLLTGGDNILAEIVSQIVGDDKVHTTQHPIVLYPLYRNGGIRCMLLHSPQTIVGKPVIVQG
jgi:hypothetical protein